MFYPGTAVILISATLSATAAAGLDVVPLVIQQPGTQPPATQPVGAAAVSLTGVTTCRNCHDGSGVTIWSDWQGSMMSHAGRDPLFWATTAIAEQDFAGSGDLCLR